VSELAQPRWVEEARQLWTLTCVHQAEEEGGIDTAFHDPRIACSECVALALQHVYALGKIDGAKIQSEVRT
jgi:hypothetical protein